MSTTESIFRPDERRAQMMVERIPWNYKWEAGQPKPEWIRLAADSGISDVLPESTNGWYINDDGLLVCETIVPSNQAQYYWLSFFGDFDQGFVAEVEIDTSQLVFRSWQGGIAKMLGSSTAKTVLDFDVQRNNFLEPYLPGESMQYMQSKAPRLIPLPSGFYTLRWGRNLYDDSIFTQVGGLRAKTTFSQESSWPHVGIAPRYQSGGAVYVRSFKIYTY